MKLSTDLLFGPYVTPNIRRGDKAACELRGREVFCGGLTDAPIQWPRMLKTGSPSLILCGDLVRAVRIESEVAVAYHWGVSITTAWQWRKALGVGRTTDGSRELMKVASALGRLTDGPARGRAAANTPEHHKRLSEYRTGRPAHPNTRKVLLKYARMKRTKQHRESIAKAHRRLKTRPPPPPEECLWTEAEISKLGTATDRLIARLLGRSLFAVRDKRQGLLIPAWKPSRKWKQNAIPAHEKTWTSR